MPTAAAGAGAFSILDTFATQAELDVAYQSGNYTVSIDTSAGLLSRTIFLFPFSYPTTPFLTAPASDWQSGNVTIDPAFDYTFTWNPFSNAQALDVIQFAIRGSGVVPPPFPATQTSFKLAAGSLQPNTIYTCDLAFVRVAGASTGDTDIGPGYATLAKDTSFTINTESIDTDTVLRPAPQQPQSQQQRLRRRNRSHRRPHRRPLLCRLPTASPTATPSTAPGILGNISTRLRVETGNNVLIGGFIITGTEPKKIIVRAIGPSLSPFFTGVLRSGPRVARFVWRSHSV